MAWVLMPTRWRCTICNLITTAIERPKAPCPACNDGRPPEYVYVKKADPLEERSDPYLSQAGIR